MSTPHERLDQAMSDRRVELRLSWRDVAAAAEMSEAALRAIRRGRYQPSRITKRRIEDALRWMTGSVDEILTGGEAASSEDRAGRRVSERVAPDREDEDREARLRDLEDKLREALEALAEFREQQRRAVE